MGPNVAVVLFGVTLATGLSAAVLGVGFTVAPAQAAAQPAPAVVVPAAAAPSAVPIARKPATPTHTTKSTKTAKPTRTMPAGVDYSKCTNQINYADDPRSNATINSLGEQTGTCPKPLTPRTNGTGGEGAGSTGTCMDTGSCYDPAGSAPFAAASCARAGPWLPTGKNSSGSSSRQTAFSRQLIRARPPSGPGGVHTASTADACSAPAPVASPE